MTVRFDEPTALNGLKAYPDGQVEFLKDGQPVEPAEVHVDLSYERPNKKRKVLTRTSASGIRWPTHPHDSLGNADLLYWIDTNSKEVDGQWIHACAVILGNPSHTINRTYVKYQLAHGFEFRGAVPKPERLAWCEVIERLRRNPGRLLNWDVYLVVDSDLSALASINSRTIPIWGQYQLPPRFQFVYASADVGKEFPLNTVMAKCDLMASRLLDQIIRQDPAGNGLMDRALVANVPMRRWDPTQ